jgi:lysophospholipase L1-like esterase
MEKALSIFLSIILFILTVEVSARIDDKIRYDAPFFKHYSPAILRNTDSEGINCNVPNARFEKWKINGLGFPGPETELAKPKGKTRIICMGTSETFGLYESLGQEWPNQLGAILDKYNHFQVINTSVVGLSFKKFRRYIEKYVLRLDPDVVILYINFFGYGVGEEKFAKRQTVSKTNNTNEKGWKFLFEDVTSNIRILPKLKLAIKKVLPLNMLKKYQLWNLRRQLHVLESNRLNGKKPLDFVSEESLLSFRSDLEELVKFLHDKKIAVILSCYPVLITPENLQEHLEIFLDHRRFYVELSLMGIIDASMRFNQEIEAVANKYKIGYVDGNKVVPQNTNYFADNVHYTDEGARLVASSFANYIKSRWVN